MINFPREGGGELHVKDEEGVEIEESKKCHKHTKQKVSAVTKFISGIISTEMGKFWPLREDTKG